MSDTVTAKLTKAEEKFEVGMFVVCKSCDKICKRLDEFIYKCPKCGAKHHAKHGFTEVIWPDKWVTMDELKLMYPIPTIPA